MAQLEVLEGTWEELAVHAETLKGKKLRLIVLPQEEPDVSLPQQLHERAARLLAATDSLQREPGKPSDNPYKKAFGEIVTEKHKRMGLKL